MGSHEGYGRKGFQREQRGQLSEEDCLIGAVAPAADLQQPSRYRARGLTPPLVSSCLGWDRLPMPVLAKFSRMVEARECMAAVHVGSQMGKGGARVWTWRAQQTICCPAYHGCLSCTLLWAYFAERGFECYILKMWTSLPICNDRVRAWRVQPQHGWGQWLNTWLGYKAWKQVWRAHVSDCVGGAYLHAQADVAWPDVVLSQGQDKRQPVLTIR